MPKIVQYNLPPGGTVVQLADNTSEALDISSTDAKEFVVIDTSDGSEDLVLTAGGAGIKINSSGQVKGTASNTFALLPEDASATNPNIIPRSDDPDTGVGWAEADALSLVAGGVEAMRLSEDTTIAAQINGQTIIKVADTNVAADAACDDFIIEGTGATGATVLTPNNQPGCVAFRSENGGGSDKSTLMIQGLYNSSNKALGKFRLMSGSSADDYLEFETNGAQRLKIDGTGSAIFNSDVSTIGKLATALTGTFTATNGSTAISSGSSTAFTTELHVGSAIKIGSEVFTVTAIASDTALTLDSAFAGSTASGLSGTTDSGELFAVKTGDSKSILSVNATGVLGLSTTPDQGTDANGNNLGIGDPDMFNAVTSALRTTIIGNCRSNTAYSFTTGDSTTLIGFEAGRAFTSASRTVAIGAACANTATGTNDAVIIGMEAGQSAGNNSVYAGAYAGKACTGQDNVGIGREALDNSSSATESTAVGYQSLSALTGAVESNTGLGFQSGLALTSGQQCTFLGAEATTSAATVNNQTAIGYGATTDAVNQVRVGNTSVADIDGQVALTATSDARVKTNVQDLNLGLDFINALRPVSFSRIHPADWPEEIRDNRYKKGRTIVDEDGNETVVSTANFDVETQQPIKEEFDSTTRSDGLIAQEVKAACEALGVEFNGIKESSGGKMGIQYSLLVAPLIAAVKELTARIATLEAGA